MIKKIIPARTLCVFLAMIILATPLAACNQGGRVKDKVAAAHGRYDSPAIWKITDQDSTLYLFGTVHLMQPDIKWQRRDMQAAFDDVGTVFFEIPDDDKSALQTSILQRRYGVYPGNEKLTDHLDKININRLTAAAYNSDVPLSRLQKFKPWLAADILSVAAVDKAGMQYANSADAQMRIKAEQAHKSIRALDSVETYFDAVAQQPDWVQIRALEQTILHFNTLVSETLKVNAAWLVGDTVLLENEMLAPAKARSPELYQALFTQRNKKWSKTLEQFMQGDDNAMVIVGIGHMLGSDGLPALLANHGYKMERLERLDLPNE